jgi:secreted PhoX family phosphatase
MRKSGLAHGILCAPLLAASLLLAAGCGSKIAECNKLIEVMNAEGSKLAAKGADPAALKKMADDIDAAAKTIGAVEVKTPELVKYRDDAKKVYTDVANAARSAATAMESADLAKVTAATKQLTDATQASSKLVSDINGFCQGK